jgi:hypothetical protein
MNCLTARETLDVIRPLEMGADQMGADHSPAAMIDEAAQHVKGCPACQIAVRRREQIDNRIGQLSRDVPVPVGLRERLLARLEAAGGPIVVASANAMAPDAMASASKTVDRPAVRRGRRRWWLMISIAAASVLVAIGVTWRQWWSSPALSLDEIAESALSQGLKPDDLPELTRFQGGLALQHPSTMRALPWSQPVRRLVGPQLGNREVGIYFFTIARRLGGKFDGRLVIVPKSSVNDSPSATSFPGPGPAQYKLGFCTTAWVEGQFVYLCCVRGGGEAELLLLRPTRADPV